ncbi:PGPGW domain-containing protein [Caenispirillum salinarum]|uniref:PGPGW domain-containing protein n=1 Tax=Caenispirillum salinarum TaxID=859058 RepID=UPI001360B3A9|nr:PGPGW domain-containing protein [Caenispirillum salinarum]
MTAPYAPHDPVPDLDPPPGRTPLGRLVRLGLGWILVVVGAVTAPTPVPVGLPMVAVGLYLLARESKTVRRVIRERRRALPGFSRRLNGLKHRMPRGVRRMIEATDPLPQGEGGE